MHNSQCSFIIPYRKSTADRERNLKITLQSINYFFPNHEIIISEMDEQPKIELINPPNTVQHVFNKDTGIFNRSYARNLGALNANNDILIFTDNDLIMDPEALLNCIQQCTEVQAVNPFSICIDLTEEELLQYKVNENDPTAFNELFRSFNPQDISRHREALVFAGGILIIKKDSFFEIGGWPQEMIGWGGEDNVLSYKIEQLLSHQSFNHFVYHLPHDRTSFDWYDHPEYQENCNKMNRILEMSKSELIDYCKSGVQKQFPDEP